MSTQEDFNNRIAAEIVILKAALAILIADLPTERRRSLLKGFPFPLTPDISRKAFDDAWRELSDKISDAHALRAEPR